jgi:hypothetical protein
MPYTKKVVAGTQPPHRPIVAAQHLFQPDIAAARHRRSSISHPQPRHQLTTHSRRSDSLPQSPRQPLDVGTPLPESASSSPCRPRWSLQHRCSRLTSISGSCYPRATGGEPLVLAKLSMLGQHGTAGFGRIPRLPSGPGPALAAFPWTPETSAGQNRARRPATARCASLPHHRRISCSNCFPNFRALVFGHLL